MQHYWHFNDYINSTDPSGGLLYSQGGFNMRSFADLTSGNQDSSGSEYASSIYRKLTVLHKCT
jgi:hypothetical protein